MISSRPRPRPRSAWALLANAHAAGSDTIKVGLIGCGGRGSGAAENICEAAGTSYNIKLYAMGDVFEDHLKNCRESLRNNEHCKDKFDVADDRCFVGFDAYQKVIDCCDLVMLATPPGFRPRTSRPPSRPASTSSPRSRSPSTAPGIRKVLAAAEEAKKKGLSVVAGTQRRHQAGYLESMKRIHDGAIGDLVGGRVYWNQGDIWAHKRQHGLERHRVPAPQLVPLPLALRRPHRRAARPQPRRGLLGAGRPPGQRRRHGRPPGDHASPSAARATTTSPSTTSSPTASTS